MNTPLYNKLVKYSESKLPFHMPGHKFGVAAEFSKINMARLDNTEVMGMDNLYEAEGVIKESMELMADFYGSKQSIFLTNGATAGILTSILSTCKEGDEFIVARNTHHSVWSALLLSGVSPIYIWPEYEAKEGIVGEISKDTIELALEQYPNCKGVIIVSPTYEGVVSDIRGIAHIVHQYEKILIVDEAHGAHFNLSKKFPASSISQGADIVINSMHKTLPALTQSALLHIGSNRVSYENIVNALRMVQTSSPSYIMMGLMDYARGYMQQNKNMIENEFIEPLIEIRRQLKEELSKLRLIELSQGRYDISKIVISTVHTNIDGYDLADKLNEEFGIMVEAAVEDYIILMTTMADNYNTLVQLKRALVIIDKNLIIKTPKSNIYISMNEKISLGKNPRKVFYNEKEWINLEDSIGYVAAKNIMLYPPGIPIVAIGEMINESDIQFIKAVSDKLQGIKKENNHILLQVVKEM